MSTTHCDTWVPTSDVKVIDSLAVGAVNTTGGGVSGLMCMRSEDATKGGCIRSKYTVYCNCCLSEHVLNVNAFERNHRVCVFAE